MLRRNLKRQASRSLSAFAGGSASPRAADQENLHPNLASSPPASPAAKGAASPRPKHPAHAAAAPPPTVAAEADRAAAAAPADNQPSVKVP